MSLSNLDFGISTALLLQTLVAVTAAIVLL